MKALIILAALILAGCVPRTADRKSFDPVVYHDSITGCEYLTTGQASGITPRMDATGQQICVVRP